MSTFFQQSERGLLLGGHDPLNSSKKKISKSEAICNDTIQLCTLLLKFLKQLTKLCWTITLKLVIFFWALTIQPILIYLLKLLTIACNSSSIKDMLNFGISFMVQLQKRIPSSMESTMTALREIKKKKTLPFSINQFSDQQTKKMFKNPVQFLKSPSNQVLYKTKQGKNKISVTYYVPTYLRVLFKNFTAIDLDKLQAEVNANIIITFVYGNKGLTKLPKEIANRLNHEVVLNFERDDPLRLTTAENDNISVKQDENKSYITFTVRKKVHLKIQSDVYYTPFERLDLLLPITIQQLRMATLSQPLYTTQNKNTIFEAGVKFNFMNNNTPFVTLDFKQETDFGNYSLIQSGIETTYSNKKILSKKQEETKKEDAKKEKLKNQKEEALLQMKKKILDTKLKSQTRKDELIKEIKALEDKKARKLKTLQQKEKEKEEKKKDPSHFQYSCFKIPIYKHPLASLVMIFLPLWALAIINLGIFFQDSSLPERIAAIGGVMIAFIALIPTIRSQIPPNPKVMFVQILVYIQIFASFLCLINSLQIRSQQDYNMIWYENIYFLISLIIFLSEIVIIFVMSIYHYGVNVPNFQLDENEQEWKKDKNKNNFNHLLWENKQCDKTFAFIIQKMKEQMDKCSQQWEGKLVDLKDEIEFEKNFLVNDNKNITELSRSNKARKWFINVNEVNLKMKEQQRQLDIPQKQRDLL